KGLEQAKCYQNDQGIRELLRLYDVLTQRPSIQRDDAQEVEVDSCHHQPLERMERSGSQV
ncbi:MAG: hypothetical protein ACK523_13375, partial [Pirellulaceae bacterium]